MHTDRWFVRLVRRRWWVVGVSLLIGVVLVVADLRLTVVAAMPSVTPAVQVTPALYYATPSGVYAVRADTGQALWHTTLPLPEAELMATGGALIAMQSTQITLLDEGTGRVRWRHPLRFNEQATVQRIVAVDATTVYVALQLGNVTQTEGLVLALARADGRLRWQFAVPTALGVRLMQVNDLLLVGADAYVGIVHDLTLTALSVRDGAVRWHYTQRAEHLDPLGVSGGVLIIRAGGIVALALTDGAVLWRTSASVFGSLACVSQDTVYTSFYESVTPGNPIQRAFVAAYHARDGRQMWQRELTTGWIAQPAICGGDHLLVLQEDLAGKDMQIDGLVAATGAIAWRATDPQLLGALPLADPTRAALYAFGGVGVTAPDLLRAFDLASGATLWQTSLGQGAANWSSALCYRGDIYMAVAQTPGTATLTAVDVVTGDVQWQQVIAQVDTFPLLVAAAG